MRRHTWFLVCLAGCASTSTAERDVASTDVVTTAVGPRQTIDLTRHSLSYAREYPATREAVWSALLAAAEEIAVPVQAADPAADTVVYYLQADTPRIAGRPAATWVDCGTGAGGAARAATYRVTLTVRNSVESPPGGGTRVRTMLVATARNRGVSADAVQCTSTGRLERRILEIVAARLSS